MTLLRLAHTLCSGLILVAAFVAPASGADAIITGTINFTVTGCQSYIGGPVIDCPVPPTVPAAQFTYNQTTSKFISFIGTYAGATYDFVNDVDLQGVPVVDPANNPQILGSVPCVSGTTGGAATFALLTSCSGVWAVGDPLGAVRGSVFGFVYTNGCCAVVNVGALSPIGPLLTEGGTYSVQTQITAVEVDPVPALLCGQPAVISPTAMCGSTTGTDVLATQGAVVQGVVADGVTQLVLRVSGINSGDQVSFTLFNDESSPTPSNSPAEDGALGNPGDASFTQSQITVAAVSTTNTGPMAFAVYRAPIDFPRANNTQDPAATSRNVTIQVQDMTTGASSMLTVKIVRPPVMLVHGNWSSPADWTFFSNSPDNALVSGNCASSDSRFRVYCLNYSTTMERGIAYNAQRTHFQLANEIHTFKIQAQVAAVQADVVGYSMGGLIARDWVANTSVPFLRLTNFLQGDVHKLITIDTPHLGSILANRLLESKLVCKAAFNNNNSPVQQNIVDLAVGSSLLQMLNKIGNSVHLPAQVVVGTANGFQVIAATNEYFLFSIVSAICPGLLPSGGYVQLFSPPISYNSPYGDSDLVVSEYSQMALGLGVTAPVNAIPVPEGVIHTVNPILFPLGPDVLNRMLSSGNTVQANPSVSSPALVINALNTPVSQYQRIAP